MTEYTIYKIICKNNLITDCYVGQTINFKSRQHQHQHKCNNPNSDRYNIKLYTFIRDNGGWKNFEMVLIAKYNCVDKFEAIRYERLHYEELNSSLNSCHPSLTKKEYCKLYYASNIEKLKEYGVLYRDNNVEKEKARHALYAANNVEKSKEYRTLNADKLKAQRAEYRTLNADKIKAKKSEVKTCECGMTYTHDHYLRHCRSKYHLSNINT
tara:strand:- start:42 stop:674 length:633 start_codon:yes stop_codon:yes gene_type:complete